MDDAALLAGFESATLRNEDFHHREHVHVAWLCLRAGTFAEAALRFCQALRRFAAANGKPEAYHETITWAFLALVNERMHTNGAETFAEFARKNADLINDGAATLGRLYDRTVLKSELARRVFLLPRGGSIGS